MDMDRLNLQKLIEGEFKEQYQATTKNKSAALKILRA
jgi:hypothetical protein